MKNGIWKIAIAFTIMLASCSNSANDTKISQDSAVNVILDSNAAIPDTNTFFDRRTDSTNLPDEPGPTITPADTVR